MSSGQVTGDDSDDAAFRARLAPLALTVLPRGIAQQPAAPWAGKRPSSRRRVVTLTGCAASVALLSAVAAFVQWPSSHEHLNTIAAAPLPQPASLPASAVPPSAVASSSVPATVVQASLDPASSDLVRSLLQRGDAALADGDIIAARLHYERAAKLDSAAGATAFGKTYDKEFLIELGALGVRADPSIAATWYRKAAARGDKEATDRLRRIEGRSTP